MSRARFLQKDLLAKAMTRGTRILGVPFNFALNNIALFMTLMLVFYTVTQKAVCLMVAIGGMTITHLVMMILSLKEERALEMIFSNFSLCASTPFDDTQSYTSLTTTIKKPPIKERSSEKHLPWTHLYNEHTVMTKKGELLQVLTLEGVAFHTEEDATLDDNKNLRNRLLYQMASPSIAISFYTIRRKQALYPEGEYGPGFARDFNARYKAQMTSNPRYQNALYIMLLHKAPVFDKGIKKTRRHNENIKMQRAWHDKALKTLNEQSSRIISLFKKENCRRLGRIQEHYAASELLSLLSELTNLEQRRVHMPLQALNTYLATKSHHFAKRRGIIQVRNTDGSSKYAAMLSLKEYPEETSACLLDSLLSANCELILTQSFFFKHNQPALKALQTQQRKMTKTDDSILLADAIDLSIEELKAGLAAYGEHHLSICVIANDIESLEKGIYEIESKLNQEAGLILSREEQGVELAFWAQLPGNHAYRIRHSLINSLNVASLANLHNYPLGQAHGNHWGEAITVLETLSGTTFYLNIHVGQVGNSIFIGPMGGGKTLMLAAILTFTMKYGGWRFVFDKNRGMEVIVRALGGSYNLMEPGKPSGMAPFQLKDSPENRAFNILLLKKILKTTAPLTASDEKQIEKVVNSAYELDKKDRVYRHIAPFFGASLAGSLRERFDRWHSTGAHAWVFDNEEDAFQINNTITGYDIGKLLEPIFEEVSTPTLMYLFHRIGECLDSSPTIAFVPEGWKALSDPLFEAQLKDWSKTPRKNNMALIMDTQSPEELAASSAGSSVAREAQTQVFFANSKAAWKDYQLFNLTLKEFEIIKEILPALGGYYFLLKQGNKSVIARLNLSGLDNDARVLSGTLARAKLLDEIRVRTGDKPDSWLVPYMRLSHILENDYKNSFPQLLPHFERHWEECR